MANRRTYAVMVNSERVYSGSYQSAFTVYTAIRKSLSLVDSTAVVTFAVDFD